MGVIFKSYFDEDMHTHARFIGFTSVEDFIMKRWDNFDMGTQALLKLTNNSPEQLRKRMKQEDVLL